MLLKPTKKCSTLHIIRKMQIKTSLTRCFSLIRLAKIQNVDDTLCWQSCKETNSLTHCWSECTLQDPSNEEFGNTNKTADLFTLTQAVLLPRNYPKYTAPTIKIYTHKTYSLSHSTGNYLNSQTEDTG